MTEQNDERAPLLDLSAWADKVGVSRRGAVRYIRDGRVPEAVKDSRGYWQVPADVPSPRRSPGRPRKTASPSKPTASKPPRLRSVPSPSVEARVPGSGGLLDALHATLAALPGSGYRSVSASWPADDGLGGHVTVSLSVGEPVDE